MLRHRIIFPEINKAALIEEEIGEPGAHDVLVKTAFSTVSPGTERANITGDPSIAGQSAPSVVFPRSCGYSSAGTVYKVGSEVKKVKVGDRVCVYSHLAGVHLDDLCLVVCRKLAQNASAFLRRELFQKGFPF